MSVSVLYKYCDQAGIEILRELELKLPYISQVNDPLECSPFLYCPNDKVAIEARYLSALTRRGRLLPPDYNQKLDIDVICEKLEEITREVLKDLKSKRCLLSVSETAQNTVMWAHYTDKHKGVVIGIDFNSIFPDTNKKRGISMNAVSYSKQRPQINILSELVPEIFGKALLIRSVDWYYEKEFRWIFSVDYLGEMQRQGLANLKDFNGEKTWFLRLNPASIIKVIFGLYTDDNLKSDIKKLIERQDLKHIKLYQAKESETYILNLMECN